MIRLRGISVAFDGRRVLDGLDLDLPPGTVTAVVGPNGSGKTTLGRVLLGLTAPDAGIVEGTAGVARAAVFQEDRLCGQLSAVGNVRLVLPRGAARGGGRAAAVAGLLAVGLDPASLDVPVRLLSGGQRRRVAVVRGLATDAGLVVLDEAFTGLDADARSATLSWARECLAGRTALLITHEPTEIAWFGARVVRLAGR